MASRHLSRALVLQTLFESDLTSALEPAAAGRVLKRNAQEFSLSSSDMQFAESLLDGVLAKRDEIDTVLVRAAPQWPLAQIAPIDRNVLRIGLYELLFGDRTSVPPKVALNEAIEIAKSFGGEQSGKFVNGVLGSVYRDIGEPMKHDAPRGAPAGATLAGAIVYAGVGAERRVALVRDAFSRWTLPKARLLPGELTEGAARRAIKNELGIEAAIVRPLGEHSYTAHDPQSGTEERTVSFFIAEAPSRAALQCTVCEGITDAKWFSESELSGLAVYEDLRATIQEAFRA